MKKTVLILGGAAPHIALCENLSSRGYRTVLVDYLDNPPAKKYVDIHIKESCLDVNVVIRYAQEYAVSAVLATHIDRALPVAAEASNKLNLPFHITSETAISITSKDRMKEIFQQFGIPSSNWILSTEKNQKQIDTLIHPVVCKHVNGTGSYGLFISKDKSLTNKWIENNILTNKEGVIVEEYCEGREYSVDVVIKGGSANVISARERKKIFFTENGFVLCYGAILDRVFLAENRAQIEMIAQRVADGFRLKNSPLMIQLILKKDGSINVIEVAARLSGGITNRYMYKATGVDFLDYAVSCQINEIPKSFKESDGKYYCVQILYSRPGLISHIVGFDKAKSNQFIDEYHFLRESGDIMPDEITTKSRIAEFIISGNSWSEVNTKLKNSMELIDVFDVKENSLLIRDDDYILFA